MRFFFLFEQGACVVNNQIFQYNFHVYSSIVLQQLKKDFENGFLFSCLFCLFFNRLLFTIGYQRQLTGGHLNNMCSIFK